MGMEVRVAAPLHSLASLYILGGSASWGALAAYGTRRGDRLTDSLDSPFFSFFLSVVSLPRYACHHSTPPPPPPRCAPAVRPLRVLQHYNRYKETRPSSVGDFKDIVLQIRSFSFSIRTLDRAKSRQLVTRSVGKHGSSNIRCEPSSSDFCKFNPINICG